MDFELTMLWLLVRGHRSPEFILKNKTEPALGGPKRSQDGPFTKRNCVKNTGTYIYITELLHRPVIRMMTLLPAVD